MMFSAIPIKYMPEGAKLGDVYWEIQCHGKFHKKTSTVCQEDSQCLFFYGNIKLVFQTVESFQS